MRTAEAQKLFQKLGGREGISKRILQIAQEIVDVNSYKRAAAGAGQMQVLAEIAFKGDSYWSEMVMRGASPELNWIKYDCTVPVLRVDGHLDFQAMEKNKQENAA